MSGQSMYDPFVLFSILMFFSPLLLMSFMLGSAIMSGTPFVFLFYFLCLFITLIFRHLIFMLFGVTPTTNCDNTIFLPFIFGSYKNFMSTFIFAFSIFYIFSPYFRWKQTNETTIFMFVFLIVYATYDLVVRAYYTSCMPMGWSTFFMAFGNIFLGGMLGWGANSMMSQLGLSNYLYYSNSATRPTKKVFKCGKIKS